MRALDDVIRYGMEAEIGNRAMDYRPIHICQNSLLHTDINCAQERAFDDEVVYGNLCEYGFNQCVGKKFWLCLMDRL